MPEIGKWFIFAGISLLIIGSLIWLGGKAGIPLGRLPGDINVTGKTTSFYFPIVTSVVISIILTIIINIFLRSSK